MSEFPDATMANAEAAAIIFEKDGPFTIVPIEIGPLYPDEVTVRIVATGMCHTDLSVRDGTLALPVPIALGHEGAGIVLATGERVTSVAAGDHVVLSFLSCGSCGPCLGGQVASCENFGALNFRGCRPDGSHALTCPGHGPVGDRFFGQSSFATVSIANERNVVKVRKDAPLELLGPLGCGIQTGAGAVLNALAVPAGTSIAVFGAGAVGLSAVMAAVIAGATTIVAIDRVESRLALAKELGATHTILADGSDVVEAVKAIMPGGVHFSLDTTAVPQVIANAVAALRPRGACGLVGASSRDTMLTFPATDILVNSKRIIGIIEGDSTPQIFIPQMVDLFMQGRFPIDRLIETFPLDQINEAAHASESGRVVKPVVLMPQRAA